ncbi:MAG TPA: tetratricopeptide repeat protein [Bacteroidia bacterium]|jgi:tetratricopeptide (TPR) repeat protein|nr:tetratricopeptide repeat protein [Bacteroidia bacterium]
MNFTFNHKLTGIFFLAVVNLMQAQSGQDTISCRKLIERGEEIYLDKPDSATILWNSAKNLVEKNLNSLNGSNNGLKNTFLKYEAQILSNLSFIYKNKGDIATALDYFERSLKISEEIGDRIGEAIELNNLGVLHQNLGDIPKALKYYERSLKIRGEVEDKKGISNVLNNIAVLYQQQGDNTKALEFFEKNLKLQKSLNDKSGISTSLNNIGFIYENEKKLDVALEYFEQALKIEKEINDLAGIGICLNNIGSVYERLGNNKKALEYLEWSLAKGEEVQDKRGIAVSLNHISGIYIENKEYNKALAYALKSMKLSKEIGYPVNIKPAAENLSRIYKALGDYKNSMINYELSVLMRDSIAGKETKKAILKNQLRFEFEKREIEIKANLKADLEKKEVLARVESKKQQVILIAVSGVGLILLFFALYAYRSFLQKKRANEEITRQKTIIEGEKKEILDSINYAQRIQRTLLPSEKNIEKMINRLTKEK